MSLPLSAYAEIASLARNDGKVEVEVEGVKEDFVICCLFYGVKCFYTSIRYCG